MVVKVQRPDIREQIVEDLEAMEQVAQFLDTHTELGKRYEFGNMLVSLRKSLLQELDFKTEANNLAMFIDNLREFESDRDSRADHGLHFIRVLTMEYIPGKKITDISPLRLMEIDGPGLADELFRAYLQQILVDGVFHADPHPGNVFLTDDERIALLDLGMVARLLVVSMTTCCACCWLSVKVGAKTLPRLPSKWASQNRVSIDLSLFSGCSELVAENSS